MDIVLPRQQDIWRWPAVVNFTVGSMGAGYYVWIWLAGVLAGGSDVQWEGSRAGIVAAGLILSGFFALFFESGNPLRSYFALLNVQHSWMSRELWLAAAFVAFIGLHLIYPLMILVWAAAFVAFMFIVSQAFIIYKCRAISPWNVRLILPLFILTGLSSGFGLFLIIEWRSGMSSTVPLLGGATWVACLVTFISYIRGFSLEDHDFRSATRRLRTVLSLLIGVWVGLVLPFALLATVIGGGIAAYAQFMIAVAGVAAIVGAWRRNSDILINSGNFRRIGLSLRLNGSEDARRG